MSPPTVPSRGDIIWIDFDPQAGREQKNRRPALVLSPRAYNEKVRLCIACPITSCQRLSLRGRTPRRSRRSWRRAV